MVTRRHELTLEQYKLINPLLPGNLGKPGPNVDNLTFLNGVFWYLKTGVPWRDLPERYGHWKAVHRRFSRCFKAGLFQKIFKKIC